MKIINITKNSTLAGDVVIANRFLSRTRGLIGKRSLGEGQALVITGCRQIHMFFMRFPIDAVFLDRDNRVVGLVKDIKPFRLSLLFWRSCLVIELPAGSIQRTSTELSDIIQIDI